MPTYDPSDDYLSTWRDTLTRRESGRKSINRSGVVKMKIMREKENKKTER